MAMDRSLSETDRAIGLLRAATHLSDAQGWSIEKQCGGVVVTMKGEAVAFSSTTDGATVWSGLEKAILAATQAEKVGLSAQTDAIRFALRSSRGGQS